MRSYAADSNISLVSFGFVMKRERVLRIAVLLTMFAMMTSWLPVYDLNADLVENQERESSLALVSQR